MLDWQYFVLKIKWQLLHLEKKPLIRKSNFIEWHINTKTYKPYWKLNGLIATIGKPKRDLYYNDDKSKSDELAIKFYLKESEYNRNNHKDLGAIFLKTSEIFNNGFWII